jgi:hypothetical protein
MENDMDQMAGVEEEREPQEWDSYLPVISERNLPTERTSVTAVLVWCLVLDRFDAPWWVWAMLAFVAGFHAYSVWGMRRRETRLEIGPFDAEGAPTGAVHILYDPAFYDDEV